MRAIVPALVLLGLLAGCAHTERTAPSASPATTINDPAACAAAGGKWKTLTHHCDMD